MDIEDYINNHTHVMESENKHLYLDGCPQNQRLSNNTNCYLHGFYTTDNSNEDSLIKYLAQHNITEVYSTCGGNVANYGYSETENKWYGWSHRGIFGFTVGSKVKKGDVAYNADNKENYEEDLLNFFAGPDEPYMKNSRIERIDDNSFNIVAEYTEDVPNERLRNTTYKRTQTYPEVYGRGEWEAKTIEDAREMAINYANNIS